MPISVHITYPNVWDKLTLEIPLQNGSFSSQDNLGCISGYVNKVHSAQITVLLRMLCIANVDSRLLSSVTSPQYFLSVKCVFLCKPCGTVKPLVLLICKWNGHEKYGEVAQNLLMAIWEIHINCCYSKKIVKRQLVKWAEF